MTAISRKYHLAEKVVFVDGLPGCGKTLFSTLIAALDRVELLSYAYEIEHCCSLYHLDKIAMDAAKALIRIQADLKLYNIMMGRDLNFRPTDLSSALKNHNPARYFQRLFAAGDEAIPGIIEKEQPILNLAVHNLISYSYPIWEALGERCVFVEIVRHPLYMVRQQSLNMEKLLEDARDFTVYFSYKNRELPYYVQGWEDAYINSTPMERAVHLIDQLTSKARQVKQGLKQQHKDHVITIPFEPFVLDPDPWMRKVADLLQTNITEVTRRVMSEQNVPRERVAQGIDIEIYRRCGWVPPQQGASERDELLIRREDVAQQSSVEVMKIMDRLSDEYERDYWIP